MNPSGLALPLQVLCILLLHVIDSNGDGDVVSRQSPCDGMEAIGRSQRRFAVGLFGELANDRAREDGNIFVSPFVISHALSMLLFGAAGNTQLSMAEALDYRNATHFRATTEEFTPRLTERIQCFYYDMVTRSQQPSNLTLELASKIFADQNLTVLDDFVDNTNKIGEEMEKVDFMNDAERERGEINRWVGERTRGKIPELFPDGSITSQTRLILAASIYFRGFWETPFGRTFTGKFYRSASDDGVDVKMMAQKMRARSHYDYDRMLHFVELPYRSAPGSPQVSMILLKNMRRERGHRKVESGLHQSYLFRNEDNVDGDPEGAVKQLLKTPAEEISVTMPVFEISDELDLNRALSAMGLGGLFTPGGADLSGINGDRTLYVDKALHKTFLKVDPDGSEAAAAMGLGIGAHMMTREARFNQPFHLIIYEKLSESVLFMGRIYDPTA